MENGKDRLVESLKFDGARMKTATLRRKSMN
jgi:hypothetical protein